MTLRRNLLLAPLGLAACSVLPDRPYVETQRFPLEPRRTGAPRSGRGRRTLLLLTLRAGAGMETRNLRAIRPAGIEESFLHEAMLPSYQYTMSQFVCAEAIVDRRIFSS